MLTTPKWLGLLAVAFVAGSFIASPELRAFAANTVNSSDIINETIQSVDIKNGEVKASDIATDAVGAAELQGVTKLLFGQCSTSSAAGTGQGPGASAIVSCRIAGADTDDSVMATLNYSGLCYGVEQAFVRSADTVWVQVKNDCSSSQTWPASARMAVIVYDK
jgi:hypothetical protein